MAVTSETAVRCFGCRNRTRVDELEVAEESGVMYCRRYCAPRQQTAPSPRRFALVELVG